MWRTTIVASGPSRAQIEAECRAFRQALERVGRGPVVGRVPGTARCDGAEQSGLGAVGGDPCPDVSAFGALTR